MPAPGPYPFARHTDALDLRASALIVVDLQHAFTDPREASFVRDAPQAVDQAVILVDAFRRAHRPVAFTRHAHVEAPTGPGMGRWWSSFILEGSNGAELDLRLQPRDGELVLRKDHYSAFRRTDLDAWLRARGIDTLVLAGTMTHICVDTSARDAFMHGYDVVVATDACASKHRALHDSALLGLSHAVARLVASQAIVTALGEAS